MAWEQVEVKGQIETVMGMRKNNLVDIPNILISDTINLNGKDVAIESSKINKQDNILKITLAVARTTKEKSDDKPIKRRSWSRISRQNLCL